jgi:carboxymethylenebutenolidase
MVSPAARDNAPGVGDMSSKVEIASSGSHRFDAWRSDPAGKPKGGVVVLHAIYGLTTHMGDVCDRWASHGYAAIAPALFDRVGKGLVHAYSPEGGDAGRKCYQAAGETNNLADIAAAAAAFDAGVPRIVSGFCTGGTLAWVASATQSFDAQVNFYGSHVARRLGLSPRCPTVMHYGDNDHVVPVADIERIKAAHPGVVVHVYPGAKHAFYNREQLNHDARSAELAWQRSIEFLVQKLGSRPGANRA